MGVITALDRYYNMAAILLMAGLMIASGTALAIASRTVLTS